MGEFHLGRLAQATFDRFGDYELLHFDGNWYRSGILHDRAVGLTGGLVELGISPGDRIVVMLPNSPDVGVIYGAAWAAGAAVTPAMFLLPPDEVRRIITDSGATAAITSPDFLPTIKIASEGARDLKWIISTGEESDGVISLHSLENSSEMTIVDRDDGDLAALLYTGGTTGQSKGVMLTHENLAFCARGAHRRVHNSELDSTITALPLSHGFGILVTVTSFFAEEPQKAFLMPWFDAAKWCELVQEFKIKRAAAVPSMIQMLLAQPLEDYDLSSWRWAAVGAAPLARETIEEFERRVPSCEIYEGYGLTESGTAASQHPVGKRRPGAVGMPFEGYEVKIVDPEDTEVAVGETGEICIRSRGVMKGYWNAPEVTAQTLRGGWLHTGDVGKVDEDGYIYIVDRIKDLIIRGGFNVYPRDVEDVLLEHPAVELAGVVGRPDQMHGEEVVAFVSLRSGQQTTPEELIEHAKERIGGYKYPREVRIVGYVPLTPVGKVDRKALRQML